MRSKCRFCLRRVKLIFTVAGLLVAFELLIFFLANWKTIDSSKHVQGIKTTLKNDISTKSTQRFRGEKKK